MFDLDTLELIIRLVLAGVAGIIVGFNREMHAKEAGIRTHFFVGIGSALFMIVSKYGFEDLRALGIHTDASRIASQVVTGVGFLGAGSIMVGKRSIQGLTTAAGLWATSAIGLSIGAGQYIIGGFSVLLLLLGYSLLRILNTITPVSVKKMRATLKVDSIFSIEDFLEVLKENGFSAINYDFKIEVEQDYHIVKLSVQLLRSYKKPKKNFLDEIGKVYTVLFFDISS